MNQIASLNSIIASKLKTYKKNNKNNQILMKKLAMKVFYNRTHLPQGI